MNNFFALIAITVIMTWGSPCHAQTLDWGSEVFSDLVDSEGETLDSMFVFQLGAFVEGFTPDEDNVGDWADNWRVFDQAAYNQANGYFTGTAGMADDGTGLSSHATAGFSFEGLSAYIWVRNGDDPVEGTEWFLARADSWVFPDAVPGCCDNEPNAQWSVSELDGGDVPVWGSQGGITGNGSYTVTGNHSLQTFTFVPEPSSPLLSALAVALAVLRRRRAA